MHEKIELVHFLGHPREKILMSSNVYQRAYDEIIKKTKTFQEEQLTVYEKKNREMALSTPKSQICLYNFQKVKGNRMLFLLTDTG